MDDHPSQGFIAALADAEQLGLPPVECSRGTRPSQAAR